MQVKADNYIGPIWVIMQHVVRDFVVVGEAKVAVGALVGEFVHASILAGNRWRRTGSNDTLSWDR
ncbi:MAG TPA: hypothetical protein VFP09_10740 [Desertimonas sp.]|nr:hypothetical protein [Desertimonas sp.]